jgi:hypothetical protein
MESSDGQKKLPEFRRGRISKLKLLQLDGPVAGGKPEADRRLFAPPAINAL